MSFALRVVFVFGRANTGVGADLFTKQSLHTFGGGVARSIEFFDGVACDSPGILVTAIIVFSTFSVGAAGAEIFGAARVFAIYAFFAFDAHLAFACGTETVAAKVSF